MKNNESAQYVPLIMLDGKKKVKLELNKAQIRFVSTLNKNKVVQKEIKLADLAKLAESQFDSWEFAMFNAHHLM